MGAFERLIEEDHHHGSWTTLKKKEKMSPTNIFCRKMLMARIKLCCFLGGIEKLSSRVSCLVLWSCGI